MGIKITVKGADYSQWFGGSVDVDSVVSNYKTRFSTAGGALSASQEASIKKMLNAMGSSLGKFTEMYLFLGTNATTQALGIMDKGNLTFGGSGMQYLAGGYKSSGTSYAKIPLKPSFGFTIGCFHEPVAVTTADSPRCCLGAWSSSTGAMVSLVVNGSKDRIPYFQVREKTDVKFALSGVALNTIPAYMIGSDNNGSAYLVTDTISGLNAAHNSMVMDAPEYTIGCLGLNSGTIIDALNTTYKVAFIAKYMNATEIEKVASAINTFLADIGR